MNSKRKHINKGENLGEHTFINIYYQYVDELSVYGAGLGFNKEILKDAIQDVFYRLYVNKNSLDQIRNIKYYLFRSLKNRLLDIRKTTMLTEEFKEAERDFVIQPAIVDKLISEEDRIIIQDKIQVLFSQLTGRQREAIYLRFIQEMEYDEIGKLLDMTPQASRKLVSRAMERMRKNQLSLILFLLAIS